MTTIKELSAMTTFAARADWLIRCPDWGVVGYVASMVSALEALPFPEAVTFITARHASLLAERSANGELSQTVLMPIHFSRGVMIEAARARDGGAA